MRKRITEEEIKQLYSKYNTPPHVIGHCREVAFVAETIGKKLNEHGYNLDIELIKSAGLVHDVARIYEQHWNVGADILESMGYLDEAAIVRVHMLYAQFNHVSRLNETDMVCLADKLVIEDRYAGVDARFRYIMNKAPKLPEVQKRIMSSKAVTAKTVEDIEAVIGVTIEQLFTGEK